MPSSQPDADKKMSEQQKQIFKWQNKLLPWLIITPSVLILLFLYLATKQVNRFNEAINVKGKSVTENLFPARDSTTANKLKVDLEYIKWMTLAKMEEEGMNKRYHQGGLLLLSRIFIKYLGFLTGMIIAIVGAVFIIGKLSEDQSTIEGSAGDNIKLSIVSASPGIIFGIMGTILMVSAILQHSEVAVTEQPMYLNPNTIQVSSPSATPSRTINPIKISSLDPEDKDTTK